MALSSSLLAPTLAHAHPDLDRGIASAEEAEFESALASFERAIASGTLTRDELITLLSERALVLHALGQRGALAWDLATLALLDPGHDLGRRAPPELTKAFAEAGARQGSAVEIFASCTPSGTGMRITTEVHGLSDPSLGSVRIRTKRGQASENVHDGEATDVALSEGESLSYSAELVGIGEVVLASDGSTEAPKLCEAPDLGALSGATAEPRKDGKNRKMWWWIGAGGAAAVAVITVGFVVANSGGGSSSDTAVGKPMVTFK